MKRSSTIISKFKYAILSSIVIGILSGCTENNTKDNNSQEQKTEDVRMEKPEQLGMDERVYDAEVNKEGMLSADAANSELVAEAVSALHFTDNALIALSANDKKTALSELEAALGKLEVLLARDPNLAFVPVDASVERIDLVADLETIKAIKKTVRKAMKDDHFQLVRDEVANLASELQVTTVELPLATFPDAIRTAVALIEKNDIEGAKTVLYAAMNTLVITEERIPLPILRAQVLIDEAKALEASDEDKKTEILTLLENAEYQLIMAEELGYGKRDQEYAELNKAIKEIKKSVNDDVNAQELFEKLKAKLMNFKNRISA